MRDHLAEIIIAAVIFLIVSVMGFHKGGAMAAEQAQSTKPTS